MLCDNFDFIMTGIIGTFVLVLFFAVTEAIISSNETKVIYAAECSKIGGKAVWNGARWECLPTNSLFNYGDD